MTEHGDPMDLIERLSRATRPDRELDWDIHVRNGLDGVGAYGSHPAYTASIDAAVSLAGPNFSWVVHGPWTDGTYCAGCATTIGGAWDDDLTGATAAIALCIAILRATRAP